MRSLSVILGEKRSLRSLSADKSPGRKGLGKGNDKGEKRKTSPLRKQSKKMKNADDESGHQLPVLKTERDVEARVILGFRFNREFAERAAWREPAAVAGIVPRPIP